MSGLGRRTHYRKHLTNSVLYDYPEPSLKNQCVAKIISTRGSNQFDIQLAKNYNPKDSTCSDHSDDKNDEAQHKNTNDRDTDPSISVVVLAILPTKFRKLIWLKRNDYVIVQFATDDDDNVDDDDDENDVGEDNTNHNNAISDVDIDSNDFRNQSVESTIDKNINRLNLNNADERMDVLEATSTATIAPPSTNDNGSIDERSRTIERGGGGGGIRFMIVHILYKNQIQHLLSTGLWPIHDPDFDTTKAPANDYSNRNPDTASTVNDDGIVYMNNCHSNYIVNDESKDRQDNNDNNDDDDEDANYDYDDDTSEEEDDDLFINTNRMARLEVNESDDE
jgi:Translation initiation factor 1A / IF-1